MPKRSSIRVLYLCVFLFAFLAAAAVLCFRTKYIGSEFYANLTRLAWLTANGLDAEKLERLSKSTVDIKTDPDYLSFKEYLHSIKASDARLKKVSILGNSQDDTFYYLIDSSAPDAADHMVTGSPFISSCTAFHRAFKGDVVLCNEIQHIWHGYSLSAFVPIRSKIDGNPFALVCITADVSKWNRLIVALMPMSPVMIVSLQVIFALGFLFFAFKTFRYIRLVRKQNEDSYRQLFEEMHEAFALHEMIFEGDQPVDYLFIAVNSAFEKITGLLSKKIIGRKISEVIPEISKNLIEKYGNVVKSGESIQFETYFEPFDKHYEVKAFRTAPNHFACTFIDITERKINATRIQNLLAASEESRLTLQALLDDEKKVKTELKRLARAIEEASDTIVITDLDGNIQYANPAFERITGYTREEALGKNPRVLKSNFHDAAFYEELWQTLKSGKTWEGRFTNRRKDGTLYTEDATISPVRDENGQIINYVAVKSDITDRIRMEAQLTQALKMDSIGRMASGMAHDVSNLTMGILGSAQLCRELMGQDHNLSIYIEDILIAAERLADLNRQLISLARKESVVRKIININDAIDSIMHLLRRMLGNKINLLWRPGENIAPILIAPTQIDQIVINICANAKDAIANNGTITVETSNVTVADEAAACIGTDCMPGNYVLLKISDTGCGMSPEILANIFEPFFTTKTKDKGSGLGLTAIYGIIKQNHGSVYVESNLGQGTTFNIYLPQTIVTEDKKATGAERKKDNTSTTMKLRVLLLEDEAGLRRVFSEFLKKIGCVVYVTSNSTEVLDTMAKHGQSFNVFMTDISLGNGSMSGKEIAATLKKNYPGLRVLYVSGDSYEGVFGNHELSSMEGFINKPFSIEDLSQSLAKLLQREIK